MIPSRSVHENAVSPVVGVMLMLVVTIVIAAVVSAFAGGFSEGTKKAPQCTIQAVPDVKSHLVTFEHKGGDPFSLDEVEIVFQIKDEKISLSPRDVGDSCVAFNMSSGSTGTMVKPGYSFVVIGSTPSWINGITYGPTTLTEDTRVAWSLHDKRSSKTIASGEFVL